MDEQKTVLVVEDEVHLLYGIRDILEYEQYHVLTAGNGMEGLEVLKRDLENPPDIIVSDIMMPHMDGFTFLEEVRKIDEWVRVPFIFLTAKDQQADRFKGGDLGADVYLTKPFAAEELLHSVKASLKRHHNIRRVQEKEVTSLKKEILKLFNHEFRTPMSLVIGYADMLKGFQDNMLSEEDVMEFLKGVSSGANRLRRLVENFIQLLEIKEGDAAEIYRARRRPVAEAEAILRDAKRSITNPDDKDVTINLDIASDLPLFVADVQLLTICLRELLDNAVKFSEDGGKVDVSVAKDGEEIVFKVRDYGRGIPKADFENIWDELYQINREHYEDQGSGCGLAIVDGAVKIHGGSRNVESEGIGNGSTFTIRIPVTPPDNPDSYEAFDGIASMMSQ